MLTALALPAPGTVDLDTEAAARLRDLSLMQLANGRQAERAELVDVLKRVRDSSGGLVLTNEIRSPSSPLVAFEVRYQAYNDPELWHDEKGRGLDKDEASLIRKKKNDRITDFWG
jgi:hypothetical protein